jgi:hypothetical protein
MHNEDLKNLKEVIEWIEQVSSQTADRGNSEVRSQIAQRQRDRVQSLKNIENAIQCMCQSIRIGFGSTDNADLYVDHGQWAVNLKTWAESFSGANSPLS